jgi:GNAT superfamily N-acetyltransferase
MKPSSDYFISLQFTEESMATKIKSEGILLRYSLGAFEGKQLVGFMLHGYDVIDGEKTIYNAGTGVIPSHRGQGITTSLYQYAIPLLAKEGIRSHLLEVIDNNYPAMHVYEKIGFRNVRKLYAYKNLSPVHAKQSFAVKRLNEIPSEAFTFSEMASAWQNSLASVERDRAGHQLVGIFDEEAIIAFAAYIPSTGRVKQLSVHPQYRRKDLGTWLMHVIQQNSSVQQLVVTNIDESYEPGNDFLQSLGFDRFLGLYEMRLRVE